MSNHRCTEEELFISKTLASKNTQPGKHGLKLKKNVKKKEDFYSRYIFTELQYHRHSFSKSMMGNYQITN